MGFVNVTGDSPTSELVAAVVPTAAARSGLLATSGAPLEPLDPFPNGHWSVVDEEYVADRFKMSFSNGAARTAAGVVAEDEGDSAGSATSRWT